jgi:polar amino acid transport system substrate-binding protein
MSDTALTDEIRLALAPTGTLRAGINLSNFLLVTGKADNGDPQGVSPSMAAALAARLGVSIEYVTYESPGLLADAAAEEAWDVGLIGAEPSRAEKINFSAAYTEIESTYLVRGDSPLQTIADVDQPGVRIAVAARAAYDLWLERNIKHAELVRVDGLEGSFQAFLDQNLDVLSGLRPRLITDVERIPGARIMDGQFSAVQQAIGTPKTRGNAAYEYLRSFVEETKASGQVGELVEKFGVVGRLSVAPAAE